MYTYAFLRSSAALLDLPTGIVGDLELIQVNQLSALVEPDLSVEPLQNGDDRLMQAVLAHDLVIREVFQQAVVLPLRFGTCFVSKEGLVEHLQSHSSEYLTRLASLEGKAEYTIKFVPLELPEVSIPPETTGKNYFLAKKQRYQTQAELQQQQQDELLNIVQAIAQIYPNLVQSEPGDGIQRLYLLADQLQAPDLQAHFQTWQTQCQWWEMALGEALPPYHFV